jgi:hypothetical protein
MKTEETAQVLVDKGSFSTSGDKRVAKTLIIQALRSERKKIAEEVKALGIGDITTTTSIYNAILEGGNG